MPRQAKCLLKKKFYKQKLLYIVQLMIVQSKSFDQSLLLFGLEMQDMDKIDDENRYRFVRFYAAHDSDLISKGCLEIPAKRKRPALVIYFTCSTNEIELTEIEHCFDFQKQAEARLNFKPRTYRRRRKCCGEETRQLFLAIFR